MQRSIGRELGIIVFKALTVLVTIILVFIGLGLLYDFEEYVSDGYCNVAVFPVEGVILPYIGIVDAPFVTTPAVVEDFFIRAETDPNIGAILVEVNSPGGTPVAAERIAERLRSSSLPVLSLIGDQGASGGYLVAAAADYVIASAMSDVGSIGVNMSYLEESDKLDEEGYEYIQLTTGKFKDAGTPYRPITEEERTLFQEDLDAVHNHFVDLIATYRNLSRERVDAVADGATMVGSRALENKLIDVIGGRAAARESLGILLDIETEDVVFCEYEPPLLIF